MMQMSNLVVRFKYSDLNTAMEKLDDLLLLYTSESLYKDHQILIGPESIILRFELSTLG